MKSNNFSGQEWLIAGAWLIVQSSLLFTHGIHAGGEAEKIIREARHLIETGAPTYPVYYSYFTEILLTAFCLKTGTGFWPVIALQLLLNLYALIFLFRFLKGYYSSGKIAMAAAIMLTICIPFQEYNVYLYTESLFFSLGIIFSCILLKPGVKNLSWFSKISVLLLLLCMTRPSGLFLAAATAMYVFFSFSRTFNIFYKIAFIGLSSFVVLWSADRMAGYSNELDLTLPFREGHILCGVPSSKEPVTGERVNSISGLMRYVFENPVVFSELAWKKTVSFFGLIRTHYSWFHNLFLISFFYPLYLMMIFNAVKSKRKPEGYSLFSLSLIFVFWISVVFSCDEWSNRFFITLTPFLIAEAFRIFSISKGKESISHLKP